VKDVIAMQGLSRTMFRSLIGVALAALATWFANYLTERIFGPEELEAGEESASSRRAA
jgi:hypothetical protein